MKGLNALRKADQLLPQSLDCALDLCEAYLSIGEFENARKTLLEKRKVICAGGPPSGSGATGARVRDFFLPRVAAPVGYEPFWLPTRNCDVGSANSEAPLGLTQGFFEKR